MAVADKGNKTKSTKKTDQTGLGSLLGSGDGWLSELLRNDPKRAREMAGKVSSALDLQNERQRLQNIIARGDALESAKRAAGYRPGQYVSETRQRELLNPESKAEKLERLRFHGGMANGRWVTDYDTWKAASKNGHGTDANGKEIAVKSFGFGPKKPKTFAKGEEVYGTTTDVLLEDGEPTNFDENGNPVAVKKPMKGSPAAVAGAMNRMNGDRTVSIEKDQDTGETVYRFTQNSWGPSARAEAMRKLSTYDGKTDEQRERDWLFDDDGQRKELTIEEKKEEDKLRNGTTAALRGGELMRDRGWLDAIFNGGMTRAALKAGRARR